MLTPVAEANRPALGQVQNLDHLAKNLNLLKQLTNDAGTTEARFGPLHAQYKILEKFEVGEERERAWRARVERARVGAC